MRLFLLLSVLNAAPTPCRLHGGLEARCGTLEVPEDRTHPALRTLHLAFAVVPALAQSPQPDPLFLLAGGPGESALNAFAEMVPAAFAKVHRTRDLVLVDQRGTGASNPMTCRMSARDAPLGDRLQAHLDVDRLRACLASYDADPRQYTTEIAMNDLDAVREALGYSTINLWGGSYGSRAALIYVRDHRSHVRSVILDGVAPSTMPLSLYFAEDSQHALDGVLADCERDHACAEAWPNVSAHLSALLERMPISTTVADPLTGAPVSLTITRPVLTKIIFGALYEPSTSRLLPLALTRADQGDFGPLVALATSGDDPRTELALGLNLSVICAEDLSRISHPTEHSQGTFMGDSQVRELKSACAHWPTADLSPHFGEPVTSDAPVLLLSGSADPVTPPRWGEAALETLSKGRHLVVPGAGHITSTVGCVPKLIAAFLDTADATTLDVTCLAANARPPFFLSFAGAAP